MKKTPDKGIYHVIFCLIDVFAYAEFQKNGSYGLGHNLKINRNNADFVTNLVFAPWTGIGAAQTAIDAAKKAIKGRNLLFVFSWFVPQYTPNDAQEVIIFLW